MCVRLTDLPDFPEESKIDTLEKEFSFWDLLDIKASVYHRLAPHIKQYNDNLPSTKGKLRSGEIATAKILLHLMALEMERIRRERPNDYAFYLSESIDSFPVSTNRGQLCTLLDNQYCKSTLSSYLLRLQSCGFIVRKTNTSRVQKIITDKKGKKTNCTIQMSNGRGNIIYFINKTLLIKRTSGLELLEHLGKTPKFGKFSSIDNQSFIPPQSKNLEQSLNDFQRTTLKIYSNTSANVERNVTTSLNSFSAPAGGQESNGHKKSKPEPSQFGEERKEKRNSGGEIKHIGDLLPGVKREKPINLEALERRRRYSVYVEYEQRFVNRLPRRGEDYHVFLLYQQVRHLIYPKMSEMTWQGQEVQIKTFLALHLRRLDSDAEENYLRISRAIFMVYKYLERDKKRFVYAPMTWLRLDTQMKAGTLKKAVDEWVPRERKLFLMSINRSQKFMAWQKITIQSDLMFAGMNLSLRQGMGNAIDKVKRGKDKLQEICSDYDLSSEKTNEVLQDFETKCMSIMAGISEKGKRERVPTLRELYEPEKRKNTRKRSWKKIIDNLPTIND